jgi:hypothetical protein
MTLGCTKFLDTVVEETSHSRYQEDISSILITEDGKQLVILGNKYHYVLKAPPNLSEILRSPISKHVVAKIPPLLVTEDGKITGVLYLVMEDSVPSPIKEHATPFGFRPDGWRGMFSYESRLEGVRYIEKQVLPPQPTIGLRQTYSITIEEFKPRNGEKSPLQLVLTPVTLTVDGVLMLGAVPLFAFTWLFLGDH